MRQGCVPCGDFRLVTRMDADDRCPMQKGRLLHPRMQVGITTTGAELPWISAAFVFAAIRDFGHVLRRLVLVLLRTLAERSS